MSLKQTKAVKTVREYYEVSISHAGQVTREGIIFDFDRLPANAVLCGFRDTQHEVVFEFKVERKGEEPDVDVEWQKQIADAWELLEEHLPEDAGYQGSEVEECAEYIAKYDDAYHIINDLVKKNG